MDYIWFFEQIFITIIIPLLGILTVYIINCINKYSKKLQSQTNSELMTKYIGTLNDIIITCVLATNQTYVNSLKEQNKFDLEAQKIAFEMTYQAVKDILSDETINILSMVYDDLDLYIKQQIESIVSMNRISYNDNWNNDENIQSINYNYN